MASTRVYILAVEKEELHTPYWGKMGFVNVFCAMLGGIGDPHFLFLDERLGAGVPVKVDYSW